MKILYEFIETPIILDKEYFYSLIVEDQEKYRNFLNNILNQINNKEEFLLLYDNSKKLDFSKEVMFIESVFNIETEEKKLSTFIQKDLIKNLKDYDMVAFNELVIKINEYLRNITMNYDIALSFDNDISINDFLKTFDIKPLYEEENYLVLFINKIKSLQLLFNKNIFIFNNLHLYFKDDEIEILKNEMNKLEIYFLNISSFNYPYLKNEKVILIDKDLCELTFNIKEL